MKKSIFNIILGLTILISALILVISIQSTTSMELIDIIKYTGAVVFCGLIATGYFFTKKWIRSIFSKTKDKVDFDSEIKVEKKSKKEVVDTSIDDKILQTSQKQIAEESEEELIENHSPKLTITTNSNEYRY